MGFTAIQFAWNSPELQAAIISAVGLVVASAIAAVCAAIIGKRFDDRRKLKESFETACADIEFLLAVEEGHCDMHVNRGVTSHKVIIRDTVRDKGLSWSGKYTPGRVGHKRTAEGS